MIMAFPYMANGRVPERKQLSYLPVTIDLDCQV